MYFKVDRDKSKMMWVVKGEKGGVVPAELKGKFTRRQFAEEAIRVYETKKQEGGVSKSTSKRGKRASTDSSSEELQGS